MTSPSAIANASASRSEILQNALHRLLDAAIEADYAVLGNIQLFNPQLGTLQIVAQRGFDLEFLQHFETVRADDGCSCGRALSQKRRVVVSDITQDAPYLSIAKASGYRAVQSTPLCSNGVLLGVLSTHFPDVHQLSGNATAALDELAVEIAHLLDTGARCH